MNYQFQNAIGYLDISMDTGLFDDSDFDFGKSWFFFFVFQVLFIALVLNIIHFVYEHSSNAHNAEQRKTSIFSEQIYIKSRLASRNRSIDESKSANYGNRKSIFNAKCVSFFLFFIVLLFANTKIIKTSELSRIDST